jgi:hypothetical protein
MNTAEIPILPPNWHELKTWPEPFAMLLAGHKTFEIRKEDNRKFGLGDTLILREFDQHTKTYSGRVLVRRVDYISRGPAWGIPLGTVVMAITPA